MRTPLGLTALTAAALALAACTPPNENPSPESTGDTTATTATTATTGNTADAVADTPVSLEDGVVRAKGTDNDMTSVFGTLVNNTDEEVQVTGFTTDLDAESFEIHEVVNGVMQEKPGGFTIDAGGSHELAAGGDHLMIMGHPGEIPAGDAITMTLLLGDGSEVELDPVPVRTIGAGEENYGEDGGLQSGTTPDAAGHGGHQG
nr:copper chaperone PCu(A)C [Corynebacterium halotolerans]